MWIYISAKVWNLNIIGKCLNKKWNKGGKLTEYAVHHQLLISVQIGTLFFFKFYSHNCYCYITIRTIQIHIAATNYMSMFYLFFGIEIKRVLIEKNTFRGETK